MLPHGRCRAPILGFAAALRGRECPPKCLEIGGRPWKLSGSYEHVTDRSERRCVAEMYAKRNPSCAGSVARRLSAQVHPLENKKCENDQIWNWVCPKLGNAPVLRSGIGFWVLGGYSGLRHPLSPVIRLGLRNPRKKERKKLGPQTLLSPSLKGPYNWSKTVKMVCASARVWSLSGGLLPSQHRRQSIVFQV